MPLDLTPRVLEREGCPLHRWVTGEPAQPAILLVHGAGLDHRAFAPNVAALAERHRVIACDVRGHGLSRPMGAPFTAARAVDDLVAVLDAEQVERAIVVGHSMGGNLAQELARLHPRRVRALVLADCACNTAPLSLAERVGLALTPAILALYPHRALLDHSVRSISRSAEVRAYCREAMAQLTKAEIGAVMAATLGLVREDPAYRIPRPFLLVRGAESRAGSIANQGPRWAAREPMCRGEVVIPGAGHCVNLDAPDAFDAAVRGFLDELDSEAERAR